MSQAIAKPAAAPRMGLADTWRRVKKYWFCYVLMLGTFGLLITFSYVPALSAIFHSFTIWDGVRPAQWVGLQNYREIFASDVIFRKAFVNMGILALWGVIRAVVFPLFGAALVYRLRSEANAYFFRLVYVFPIVVPATVGILVWRQLYEPNSGLFNELLKMIHMKPLGWLNSPQTALFSLMFVGFPWIDGVGLLIYLAGLLGIPTEVVEAAIVDGCGSVRRFFSIELPLIIPQLRIILMLNVIGVLQSFGFQLLVTRGGPNNATNVPAWEMYNSAMQGNRYGLASAIGVILFVIIFSLTLTSNRAVRTNIEYTAG